MPHLFLWKPWRWEKRTKAGLYLGVYTEISQCEYAHFDESVLDVCLSPVSFLCLFSLACQEPAACDCWRKERKILFVIIRISVEIVSRNSLTNCSTSSLDAKQRPCSQISVSIEADVHANTKQLCFLTVASGWVITGGQAIGGRVGRHSSLFCSHRKTWVPPLLLLATPRTSWFSGSYDIQRCLFSKGLYLN